jgi:8-amino-7-oxononanoate synthase
MVKPTWIDPKNSVSSPLFSIYHPSMSFEETLQLRLAEDQALNQTRRLPTFSPHLLRFCDNDYLGLASHPNIIQAAIESLQNEHTLGAQSARLISTNTTSHQKLETELAVFKETEAVLLFSSGYTAALGTIPAILSSGDIVILDKLAHACLIDGAKLSGAKLRVFQHNDLTQLEDILRETRTHDSTARILIVVESLYSMDGNFAPLSEIVALKDRYDAWLMVDEAHATGIYGAQGKGLCSQAGLSSRIEIQMGTLSKALGVCGGFIAGKKSLIQHLLNRSRSFLFTTASPPSLAAAAHASLQLIQSQEGETLRRNLFTNITIFNQLFKRPDLGSPIIPILTGSEKKALDLSHILEQAGFLIPAIRSPTVPKGQARLRITMKSSHKSQSIEELARILLTLI